MDNPHVNGLFDDCFREHTIAVIRELAGAPEQSYAQEDADALERFLVRPLCDWMDQFGKAPPRFPEISAADDLIECATLTIAYGFRYRQHVAPEHIDKLDRLWQEFQRLAALGVVADQERSKTETRKRNAKNAKGRHKPLVTGPALREFRDRYVYQHGFERGWKKLAAQHFKVTPATIRAHENDQ